MTALCVIFLTYTFFLLFNVIIVFFMPNVPESSLSSRGSGTSQKCYGNFLHLHVTGCDVRGSRDETKYVFVRTEEEEDMELFIFFGSNQRGK